ncbi:hypothetical protein [Streptomyces sp. NPDC044948]|uniref:hypothetical protein n=1 Tax=Streptomyces sp. NPDC044948 TaxID=3157092 RepID=UPI0033F3571A
MTSRFLTRAGVLAGAVLATSAGFSGLAQAHTLTSPPAGVMEMTMAPRMHAMASDLAGKAMPMAASAVHSPGQARECGMHCAEHAAPARDMECRAHCRHGEAARGATKDDCCKDGCCGGAHASGRATVARNSHAARHGHATGCCDGDA